jgi:superkiller protein 3
MYFIVINFCVLIFFLFLIILGLRIKLWAYIPANVLGVVVCTLSIYLDNYGMLDRLKLVVLFVLLIAVFIFDFIVTYRDIGERGADTGKTGVSYLTSFIHGEAFKIVGSDDHISTELEKIQGVSVSDKTQAFQAWKMGNQAYLKEEYKEALEMYDLSNSWVVTASANVNQSGVLLKIDRYEESLKYAGNALNVDSECVEALINQAYANEKLNRVQDAADILSTAIEINPDSYEILFSLARLYLDMQNANKSLDYINRSIRLNPDYEEAWHIKGRALRSLGKSEEALKCFDQVIKLNSNHYAAHFNKGQVLSEMDFNEEAIACFDKALKIEKKDHNAWNERGLVLNKKGKISEAIKSYQHAIKLKPDFVDAWMNLGLAQDNSGKMNHARASYQNYLKIAPKENQKYIQIVQKRLEELEKGVKRQKKVKTTSKSS